MKILYIIGIIIVAIWMIYQISKRIISKDKEERQLNIITENNNEIELSINIEKINELKQKFFDTFENEENLEITTADYVISFDKSLLNSVKINNKKTDVSRINKDLDVSDEKIYENEKIESQINDLLQNSEAISIDDNSAEIEDYYQINGDQENAYIVDFKANNSEIEND
ncbi:MAG: hypothetical protein AB8F74_19365 [Saprospiraceae bacterium]